MELFKVGQRVYCPTYGGYGVITKLGTDKATITITDMWGIGSVEIKHGDYELPKYQTEPDYNEATHDRYGKYCEGVWSAGELALTYRGWLEYEITHIEAPAPTDELTAARREIERLKQALEPFSEKWLAYLDFQDTTNHNFGFREFVEGNIDIDDALEAWFQQTYLALHPEDQKSGGE